MRQLLEPRLQVTASHNLCRLYERHKGFAYICKPSPRKDCWAKVHLARELYPMDTNGNTIESSSLIKKRKLNSSFGSENNFKTAKEVVVLESASLSSLAGGLINVIFV